METSWIIIGIVLVCSIALILYLIRRNQKDKEEVTRFFDTETENELEQKKDID